MKKYNSATLNDTKSNLFPIPENDGPLSSKSLNQENKQFFVDSTPADLERKKNLDIVEDNNVVLVEKTPETNKNLVEKEEEEKVEIVKKNEEEIPCISRTPVKVDNSESQSPEKKIEVYPKEEQPEFDPSRLPTRKEIVLEAEDPKSKGAGGCSCGSGSCVIF